MQYILSFACWQISSQLAYLRMAVQLLFLLFVSSRFMVSTTNELEKQIVALKIKLDGQNTKLQQLENLTQTQNERITSLYEINEQLQLNLEEHDLEIDALKNISDHQEDEIEEMWENNATLENKMKEYTIKLSTLENRTGSNYNHLEYLTNETIELQAICNKQQERMKYHEDAIYTLNSSLHKFNPNATQHELVKNLTDQYNKMQKSIQKNFKNINKFHDIAHKTQKQMSYHNRTFKLLKKKLSSLKNTISNINNNLENENAFRHLWPNQEGSDIRKFLSQK